MEKRDISKDVVVVLLLLTVIVALVGTWSVTSAASNAAEQMRITEESNEFEGIKTSGLVIAQPVDSTAGKASITILNPGDELQ